MDSLLIPWPSTMPLMPPTSLNDFNLALSPQRSLTVEKKKKKVTRERQLKINEASRRCRKKQKKELLDLREHVAHLKAIVQEHRTECPVFGLKYKDVFASTPPEPTKSNLTISEERQAELLIIGKFLRMNLKLEARGFSPDTIACMPIILDGWNVRLSITEKNFSIHTQKFFPCHYLDVYDFCWESNMVRNTRHSYTHYCHVTPLSESTAYLEAKTEGRWSLEVHGVPNVSYKSLLCREKDLEQAMICQQSILEDTDFMDPDMIPWLIKRWVIFRPAIHNGINGMLVESYRTASYATGKCLYSETAQYDSFCEHIIRRYAESNAMLERMMSLDGRFPNIQANSTTLMNPNGLEDDPSDRMVTNLLLF